MIITKQVKLFYTHLLSIDVYSFSKTNLELLKKVWQVVSVTSSNSNDFRESLSALILVLGKYMATDTHGNIDVELYEKQGKLVEKADL
ncbi:hypothetical protein [uncultured Mailhella sp.]|uniref:hypothetical protein n=1 Tax=uncultured Mailhella sp. TaxID=1981031 RepID=UPI002623150A|nr:hypothetical protein [uncultured Mailhella sp.]